MTAITALILQGFSRFIFATRRGYVPLGDKEASVISKKAEGWETILANARKECAFLAVTCQTEVDYQRDKATLQTFLTEHGDEYGFVALETPSEKEGNLVKVQGQNGRTYGYQLTLSKRMQSHTA